MRRRKCIGIILVSISITAFYFVLHAYISPQEGKGTFDDTLSPCATPAPVPVRALYEVLNDDGKLREVFHIDGPLNVKEADLPKIKTKSMTVMETYLRPPTLRKCYSQPACARSLRNVPGRSEWFNQRFDPRIKPFLDRNDINNWESFYNLTFCTDTPMGLRRFARRNLIRLVNNENYSAAPIMEDKYADKCVRCAVVGNSGILKGSNAGAEIDSYDHVFRMNTARLRGFERDVGSKTTVYTGFPKSMYVTELKNFENVYFLAPLFSPYIVSWLEKFLNGSMASVPKLSKGYFNNGSLLNPKRIRVIHPDLLRHFKIRFLDGRGRYPSTGAITAAVALNICDEVKLFGYGVTNSSFLHYYDQGNTYRITKGRTNHNFINEWNLWNLLEQNNIVGLSRPSKTEQRNETGI
ncbi:CMP-N-acetylneuraminate-beta-galactosamide-alpha-2,3-sialyltransferase 1-like [Ptychodera flava]|uniref:CMP-N-acetylneuraminate-beta-galactosamide- alpha-2,3-sialyltransferase 1-like n=1 Tax=Ptychodera flava TaxID=63121 RepID=UPI003969DC23